MAFVKSLILIAIFCYGFKANRNIGKGITFKKPEPFDAKQRMTLNLMLIMMAIVLIFPLLKMVMPGNELISAISPFSSGGSLILGSCGNEEERNSLFNRLLFAAVPISVLSCAVYNVVVAMIL